MCSFVAEEVISFVTPEKLSVPVIVSPVFDTLVLIAESIYPLVAALLSAIGVMTLSAPEKFPVPFTSNLYSGLVVPIPTLPLVILIFSPSSSVKVIYPSAVSVTVILLSN